MCGICLILHENSEISKTDSKQKNLQQSLCHVIEHRGPDLQGEEKVSVQYTDSTLSIEFFGSVLHLRGEPTKQPLVDKNQNILLWNGEIFAGDIKVADNENDGRVLLDTLNGISSSTSRNDFEEDILRIFNQIKGPWAFIYWQAKRQLLWFGRDYFGRRSLLWNWSEDNNNRFILSSIAPKSSVGWEEVPAQVLYCLEIGTNIESVRREHLVRKHLSAPWVSSTISTTDGAESDLLCKHMDRINLDSGVHQSVPCSTTSEMPEVSSISCAQASCIMDIESGTKMEIDTVRSNMLLNDEHQERCPKLQVPRVRVTDSALASVHMEEECCQKPGEGSRHLKTKAVNTDLLTEQKPPISCMCKVALSHTKCLLEESIRTFINVMLFSIRRRVLYVPERKAIPRHWKSKHEQDMETAEEKSVRNICSNSKGIEFEVQQRPRIGILFSGGIDSMFIAALVDRCLPEEEAVDLINVAFEKKEKQNTKGKKTSKVACGELFECSEI